MIRLIILISVAIVVSCQSPRDPQPLHEEHTSSIELTLDEANRLLELPLNCIQTQWPYKSGIVLARPEDNALPKEHHPAFYGCFDWHSAVHGHWSIVYLLKRFPEIGAFDDALVKLKENITPENIQKEVAYFSLNKESKSFERTYGWAWLLKLSEELYTWDHPDAKALYNHLIPLNDYISTAYQSYLPKLVYPIRVGEHSNTAFGLSFALDYARTIGDNALETSIVNAALRFYKSDRDCPITWEPSGYDFLSPCLQEVDIMKKVLQKDDFRRWLDGFLPNLSSEEFVLTPAEVSDRSDGKLVHLDGLNFSRAWCLYNLDKCINCNRVADQHLQFSLDKIVDGDYAGQHWLASFALYAFSCQDQ